MHLGQNLARCPRTTPEVGWWLRGFRRASSTLIVQRARHRHVAPCVVCVLGLSQLVVLAAARRPPRPTQLGDFPRKDALDARLPPPASRHAPTGDRSHDITVARPTLSPVELAGDLCVCVCVCVCVWSGVGLCLQGQWFVAPTAVFGRAYDHFGMGGGGGLGTRMGLLAEARKLRP